MNPFSFTSYHRFIRTKQLMVVAGIFAIALALRLWGIFWGLPGRTDLHPDESLNLIHFVQQILNNIDAVETGKAVLTWHTFDPVFLNYPSFLMYLIIIVFLVLKKAALISGAPWQLFLIGRCISATFGATTAIVVYWMVREMKNSTLSAAIAALFMAIMPLNVWDSHIAVTDVLMTFWIAVTLLAALRLVTKGQWRDYIFAGIALGLAVGSKYTAALTTAAVIVAALCSGRPLWHTVRGLFLAGCSSLLAFFMVAPYSLLRFRDTLAALSFEHRHTMGHHPGFSLPAMGFQYHKYLYQLVAAWPFSLGIALYGVAIFSLFGSLRYCSRHHLVLLTFLLVFFGVTGNFNFTPLRYYLPILLVFVVFAGEFLGKGIASSIPAIKTLSVVAAMITVLYTLAFSFETTQRFSAETRLAAQQWIDSNLPEDATLLSISWQYDYLGVPKKKFQRNDLDLEKNFCDTDYLAQYEYIQLTSLMYNRYYRVGNEKMSRCYDAIRHSSNFTLVNRFAAEFLNKDLYRKLDPMFEGYFISPTIELYQRMKE